MCRLLGFWSKTPRMFPDVMGSHWENFVELSRNHADGWGISWIDEVGQIRVVKEARAAFQSEYFRQTIHTICTKAALLHFRWASPGLDTRLANTHPFMSADGAVAFMHNGAIDPVERLWSAVPSGVGLRQNRGQTDSEAYFELWEDRVHGGGEPVQAIREVIRTLRSAPYHYTSLNAMILHPQTSYVVAEYQPTAPLALENPEYYQLYWKKSPDVLTVASSLWDIPTSWQRLPNHAVLTIGPMLDATDEISRELLPI